MQKELSNRTQHSLIEFFENFRGKQTPLHQEIRSMPVVTQENTAQALEHFQRVLPPEDVIHNIQEITGVIDLNENPAVTSLVSKVRRPFKHILKRV